MNAKHYRNYRFYALMGMVTAVSIALALFIKEPDWLSGATVAGGLLCLVDLFGMVYRDRQAMRRFGTNGAEATKEASSLDGALKDAIAMTAAAMSMRTLDQYALFVMAGEDGWYHLHSQITVADPDGEVAADD